MPRNVRMVGGRVGVGLVVVLAWGGIHTGVVAQATACVPPAAATLVAVPDGGASGSTRQPGPAPDSPEACWTWSTDAYTTTADPNATVAAADIVATVDDNDTVLALDATTGAERWRHTVTETVHGVTADADVVYVGGPDGLDAVAAADGTVRWSYAVENEDSPHPTWGGFLHPVAVGGTVYGVVRTDGPDETRTFTLVAIEAATGAPRWTVPVSTEDVEGIASDGAVVAVSYISLDDGLRWPDLGGFDPATGAALWVHEIRDVERWPTTRPVVTGSLVYLGSQNGEVVALGATDGKRAWRVKAGFNVDSMTVVGGTLVATAFGELIGLNATSGKERWHKTLRKGYLSQGTPAGVTDGPLVVAAAGRDETAWLYALEPRTGKQLWRVAAGAVDSEPGSPIVTGGRIIVALRSSEADTVASFGTPQAP